MTEDELLVTKRIVEVLRLAFEFSQIPGEHHKSWVIDQIVRTLTAEQYQKYVREYCDGQDGPETYVWDEGIAP